VQLIGQALLRLPIESLLQYSVLLLPLVPPLLLLLLLLLQILPVVLGVRQYSARLEMFRQLTKQLHPAAEVRAYAAATKHCSSRWAGQLAACPSQLSTPSYAVREADVAALELSGCNHRWSTSRVF
jgi:hypothetical protein